MFYLMKSSIYMNLINEGNHDGRLFFFLLCHGAHFFLASTNSNSLNSCGTIILKNSVFTRYHAFKIRPPETFPKTNLMVDNGYLNISDKDACLVWIPELNNFDEVYMIW